MALKSKKKERKEERKKERKKASFYSFKAFLISILSEVLKKTFWSSHCGAAEINPIRNHEIACSIPGLTQRVKDPALL